MITQQKTPLWVVIVIIIFVLPIFQFPALLSLCPPDSFERVLVWIYPFYIIVAGYLAFICWNQRPWMTWILLILMAITHAAMWALVTIQ